jgi:hypothetical protein
MTRTVFNILYLVAVAWLAFILWPRTPLDTSAAIHRMTPHPPHRWYRHHRG